MVFVIGLLVVLAIGYRVMKPDERTRVRKAVVAFLIRVKDQRQRELTPYRTVLKSRAKWLIVTPALIAVNVAVYLGMLFGKGSFSDPSTLLAWGATFGPRTTNGEWWRLLTAMFVQGGLLALLVNMTALFQCGALLERLVGRGAFATAYFSAGILGGLMSISNAPLAVSMGASAAVWGVYGLLVAALIGGWFHRSEFTIPLVVVKRCAMASAVFAALTLFNSSIGAGAELVGLSAGIVYGLVVARNVSERTPPPRTLGIAAGVAALIAVVLAVPLRGIADIKPEMARLSDLEQQTAGTYDKALGQFRRGKMTAEALAGLIERTIIPELQAADERIGGLHHVPHEDQGKIADAREYLRLRSDSWRLRAQGLRDAGAGPQTAKETAGTSFRARAEKQHRTSMVTLSRAEGSQREALNALDRTRPVAATLR